MWVDHIICLTLVHSLLLLDFVAVFFLYISLVGPSVALGRLRAEVQYKLRRI